MTSATTEPSRGTRGHRAEGHGFGLVLFASVLLVVIGVLARAAYLLAEALIVRLTRAFPGHALPGPALGPVQHPAGLAQGRHAAAVPGAGRQGRGAGAYGNDG